MSNPTIKKRVCDRCGKEFFETYREWLCKDCMNALGWEYTLKTNADHIRSMTDGQLAAFIIRGAERDLFFVDDAIGGSCDGWLERDELLDWLKQPYKEDT